MKLRTSNSRIFDWNKTHNHFLSFHNLRHQYRLNQENIDRSLGRRDVDKITKRRLMTALQKKKKVLCESTNLNISLNTKSTMLQNRLHKNLCLSKVQDGRQALSQSLIRLYNEKKELEGLITAQDKNIQELQNIVECQNEQTVENAIRRLHINIKKQMRHTLKSVSQKMSYQPPISEDECVGQMPTDAVCEQTAQMNESLKAAINDQKDLGMELVRKIAAETQNLSKNLRQKSRLRAMIK